MTTDTSLKTAVRDGVALRYLDAGAGDPPLLFIHGWCCDHTYWRDQTPVFAASHRVVAVDLRGQGQSAKPDQDYTIDGFVDDTLWLMKEIGLERPVIVGHSMGGVVGLNLVRRSPEAFRGLVFVDSPVIPIPQDLQGTIDGVLAGLNSPAYKDVARSFVADLMFTADADPALKQQVLDGMAQAPQRVMATALADVLREESMPPGPLPVPALYIQAASTAWDPAVIKARYPGLLHDRVECGHFIQMERPAELNEKVQRFLEGIRF